jgi:hypothetical protein
MIKNILFVTLLAGILSGCSIQQIITFNDNYSGNYNFKMDMSKGMAMMESFGDSTNNKDDNTEEMFLNIESYLDSISTSIPGISNIQNLTNDSAYLISFSYDFADVKTLNTGLLTNPLFESMKATSESGDWVEVKGKNVLFYIPKMEGSLTGDSDTASTENMEMGDMMKGQFMINSKLVFKDKVIKKVKYDNSYTVSEDKHEISVDKDMMELSDPKGTKKPELIKIKVK